MHALCCTYTYTLHVSIFSAENAFSSPYQLPQLTAEDDQGKRGATTFLLSHCPQNEGVLKPFRKPLFPTANAPAQSTPSLSDKSSFRIVIGYC